MKLNAKVGIASAVSALAIAAPQVAQACTGGAQGATKDHNTSARIHGDRGKSDFAGFRGRRWGHFISGTLVTWSATQSGTTASGISTYSGSITLTKNDARNDTGTSSTPVTFMFTNAKVLFGNGANPPAAGDVVKLLGFGLRGHSHGNTSSSSSTGTVRAIFIGVPHTSSHS
ncbi:MAG TPA: hypothetical protein VMB27_21915 [Solirubrobacteraceae bacterium]|nr:hypothetical protein [Solirubrobacteraceae bacterium]